MLDRVAEAVPYRIVEVSGTPYERGTAYGEAIKDMLPRFLKKEFYDCWCDGEKMRGFGGRCLEAMQRWTPKAAEFVRGFSDATGLPPEELAMVQAHEEFVHGVHCSVVGAGPDETSDGRVYLGQNWDWRTSMNKFKLLFKQRTERGLRVLTYAFGGLWSCVGMNSAGITLCWTSAYHPKPELKGEAREGVPTYAIIAEVLEEEKLEDAVELVMSCPNAGWFIFSLASAEGKLAKIEASPETKALTYPRSFVRAEASRAMRSFRGLDGRTCHPSSLLRPGWPSFSWRTRVSFPPNSSCASWHPTFPRKSPGRSANTGLGMRPWTACCSALPRGGAGSFRGLHAGTGPSRSSCNDREDEAQSPQE